MIMRSVSHSTGARSSVSGRSTAATGRTPLRKRGTSGATASGAAPTVEWNAEDRAAAKEEEVKQRTNNQR